MTSRPRILCLARLPAVVEERLESRFAVEWRPGASPDPDRLVADAARFDGLMPDVTHRVPAAFFEAPQRRVRIVANYGVGVDLIDVGAARRAGVIVTNTPDVLTDCTADLAMALVLMTMRRLSEGERLLRSGQWTGWRPTHHLGRRVTGATLGIVGMGRIGRAVAARARHGFGMRIIYASRSPLDPATAADLGANRHTIDELMAEADAVSLHCAATAETAGIIDARRIGLMAPHAVLINTARGALVDDAALAEALGSGRIAGAGLDVYRDEPRVPAPLLALDAVTVLPHLGSATIETRTAMGMLVADNLEACFDGAAIPAAVT